MTENEIKKVFQVNILISELVIALTISPFFSINSGLGLAVIKSNQPRCKLSSAQLPAVLKYIKIQTKLSNPPINIGRKLSCQACLKDSCLCRAILKML